jgi:hypothetical protein
MSCEGGPKGVVGGIEAIATSLKDEKCMYLEFNPIRGSHDMQGSGAKPDHHVENVGLLWCE